MSISSLPTIIGIHSKFDSKSPKILVLWDRIAIRLFFHFLLLFLLQYRTLLGISFIHRSLYLPVSISSLPITLGIHIKFGSKIAYCEPYCHSLFLLPPPSPPHPPPMGHSVPLLLPLLQSSAPAAAGKQRRSEDMQAEDWWAGRLA